MMNEVHGDLFHTTAPLIAHGVNCRGVFGAGVARQIAKRYPEARAAYISKFEDEGWKLGEAQLVKTSCGRLVANLATQDSYGRPRPGFTFSASGEAIETAVSLLLAECQARGIDRVAMPRIGCGLGGLDWGAVRPIIGRLAATSRVAVEVYSV